MKGQSRPLIIRETPRKYSQPTVCQFKLIESRKLEARVPSVWRRSVISLMLSKLHASIFFTPDVWLNGYANNGHVLIVDFHFEKPEFFLFKI